MTLSSVDDYNSYTKKDVIIKSVKGVDVSLCEGVLTVDDNILINENNSSLIITLKNGIKIQY